jgi:hypothetical protein
MGADNIIPNQYVDTYTYFAEIHKFLFVLSQRLVSFSLSYSSLLVASKDPTTRYEATTRSIIEWEHTLGTAAWRFSGCVLRSRPR